MSDYNNSFSSNDGERKQYKDPQFYSRIKMTDVEQDLSLTFKYWKGLLVFDVSKVVRQDSGGVTFQEQNSAYFSPAKAKMLAIDLEKFMSDKKHNPVGITLGTKETTTAVTFMHDKNNDVMFICNITPDGKKEKEVAFGFAKDYHYSIEYKNYEKLDFIKNYHPDFDIMNIKNMLNQFADGMLGGYGYAAVDFMRFQDNKLNSNVFKIMQKLGINTDSGYNGGGYRNNSANNFFNRNGAAASMNTPNNTGSTHREIDDLDDLLDE